MKVCKLLGAYATVSGIPNALPLFHSPCGCQYYMRYCMLIHDGIDPVILTSDIAQQEVVFGGEEKLYKAITASKQAYDPELIVVLSGCAPSLVGDDIYSVAERVREETQTDVIAVDCAGFQGDQVNGYKDVIQQVISFYAQDIDHIQENAVNLIGMIPGYDYRWRANIIALIDVLKCAGLEVNAVLGGYSTIEQFRSIGRAKLNIVLSDIRGLEIAQYLNERFTTPFICPKYLPIGLQSIKDWLHDIGQYVTIDWDCVETRMQEVIKSYEYANMALATTYTIDTTAAIVAEPYLAVSLARFLTQDVGIEVVGMCLNESSINTETAVKRILHDIGQDDCQLFLKPDAFQWRKFLSNAKPSIIYGSSFESIAARETGASRINITYPTSDEVLITERPYMGFSGVPIIMEDLINTIIHREF